MSEVVSSQNVNCSNNITGGGVDYDSGPYTVIFPAGVINVSFDVPIIDDNMVENNETFDLTIVSSSSNKVTLGSSVHATLTIFDNDCKHLAIYSMHLYSCILFIMLFYTATVVSFSQTSYSLSEGTGPAQPVLVLSNPSSTDITVEVIDANISAFGMFEGMHI